MVAHVPPKLLNRNSYPCTDSILSNNYAVVRDGIYFILDAKPCAIRFLSFSSGREGVVAKLLGTPAWGLSVSPDGHWLLYSEWRALQADLMLL